MDLKELKELDLSDGQIAVYSAVLEIGTTSLNKIQQKTGIERRNIYDIINKLIEKGFLSYVNEKNKRVYQCTQPSKVLEKIKEKQLELEELEKKIPAIKDIFNSNKQEIRAEVYRGNEAIKTLLAECLEHEESYWMGGNSGVERCNEEMHLWFKRWSIQRIEKKHIMHDLVDYGTSLEDYKPSNIKKHKKNYYKYCQLPKDLESPMVLIMFGTKVIQVLWNKQPFAFVLDSKDLHESYMKYFNYFWRNPW